MSRATIRAAMVAWLAPPNSPGINTVYRGFPKLIPGPAFFDATQPGLQAGCVAVVNIVGETEQRIAMGGPTSGKKRIDYIVEFQLKFRYAKPASTGGDMGLDATDAFDQIVDGLKARIRLDRTAASSAIWQWGEGSLDGRYGELLEDIDGLVCWASISTTVTEWLTT